MASNSTLETVEFDKDLNKNSTRINEICSPKVQVKPKERLSEEQQQSFAKDMNSNGPSLPNTDGQQQQLPQESDIQTSFHEVPRTLPNAQHDSTSFQAQSHFYPLSSGPYQHVHCHHCHCHHSRQYSHGMNCAKTGSSYTMMNPEMNPFLNPPPLPPKLQEDPSVSQLLYSWYQCGYYAGYYHSTHSNQE